MGLVLGEGGLEQGVDVAVSSWQRVAPNTVPALAKAGGNYLSSALVTLEARRLGFSEGIALNTAGFVSEGAGENLFLVQDGKLYTPPVASSILSGITRNTVIRLAEAAGIAVLEQNIPRELLYIADEVFLTGTAAEITPVRSVDKIPVGEGQARPDDGTAAEDVLRPIRRQHGRSLELARADRRSKGPAARAPSQSRRGSLPSLFEKIWASHIVVPETDDTPAVLYIDLHLLHEVTTPQAFDLLRAHGLPVRRPIAAWRRSTTRRRPCR
jgi:hypothetical protein